MPISAQFLEEALTNKCTFSFNRNNIRDDSETIIKGEWNAITHDRYRMAVASITPEQISMIGTSDDNSAANAVNVIYEEGCATMGSIFAPGLIYSDSFSGCDFYLYRGPLREIIGVHASRASGKVADPSGWFSARGAKRILSWDSRNLITPGNFGAVFVYVDKNSVQFFAVEHKNGQLVKILQQETVPYA